MRFGAICAAMTAAFLFFAGSACAQEMDAAVMRSWMNQFADALDMLTPLNDSTQTVDPARPGEYLIEYEFGTVTATTPQTPNAEDILEIDVRTQQVTDCRGTRVGASLQDALGGIQIPQTDANLAVLNVQESGIGWCWAYVGDGNVYGVEWMTYDTENPTDVTEYTLTYILSQERTVSAIRIKTAASTQAQAETGLQTAMEMEEKQQGNAVLCLQNQATVLTENDMTVMNTKALDIPVYEWIAAMGEPVEMQTLPAGGGRLLLYEGAAVTLGLDEATGVEVVQGVSVTGSGLTGPRGLYVGMSLSEAVACFRCDRDMGADGGILYIEGEAYGEPPFGEMTAMQSGAVTVRYACMMASGKTGWLEVGIENGSVSYWHMYEGKEGALSGV